MGQGSIVQVIPRCWKVSTARPRVQVRPRRVHRSYLVMLVAVNGHPLALLPPLDGRYVAVEVRRDFLPRIQPVFGRTRRWRRAGGCFTHGVLLLGPRLSRARDPNCNSADAARRRQTTAFDGK